MNDHMQNGDTKKVHSNPNDPTSGGMGRGRNSRDGRGGRETFMNRGGQRGRGRGGGGRHPNSGEDAVQAAAGRGRGRRGGGRGDEQDPRRDADHDPSQRAPNSRQQQQQSQHGSTPVSRTTGGRDGRIPHATNRNTNPSENQVDESHTNNNNNGRGRGRGRGRGIEVDHPRDGRGRARTGSGRQPVGGVGRGESRNISESQPVPNQETQKSTQTREDRSQHGRNGPSGRTTTNGRTDGPRGRAGRGREGGREINNSRGRGRGTVPTPVETTMSSAVKRLSLDDQNTNEEKVKEKKQQTVNKSGKATKAKEKKQQNKDPGSETVEINQLKKDAIRSEKAPQEQSKAKNKKNSTNVIKPLSPSIPPNQPQQTSDINYGRGETITVLHIAEKPSIAQSIANGLAVGSVSGYKGSLPVHLFTGPSFPKAPHAASCKHKVTSVAGHVFSVDFPTQFQSWDAVDPAELFHAPIVRKPTKGSIVKHLQEEGKGVNFIVLWMDCDREGENINFEVLECCMHLMKSNGSTPNFDRVYRAYFSAINPSDIKKAYNALGKPDQNQALSVDARQELDLKVGVAFSRFQTRYFQGRYGDLDSGVLSYGPCQTPTLGFCVQRHIDIETFRSEPFWLLDLGITKRGRMVRANWNFGRSFDKNKVLKLQEQALTTATEVEVISVVSKEKKQSRLIPLNTVALLKACSKALAIGPHAALQTAERLYLSGYLSYPRTESTTYPKSFDIRGTLQQQASDPRWGSHVRMLVQDGHTSAKGGVDMGDHPPITPCRSAGPNEFSGDMARVYELVVRHFIASVSPDAVWKSTKVNFSIKELGDKGDFTVTGKELVSPGFLSVLLNKDYGDMNIDDDGVDEEEERAMPDFVKGELIPFVNTTSTAPNSKVAVVSGLATRASLGIKEGMTTAPGYLTESELIGLMEKHGIGTDASIPTHIENIQKRNYVSLASGRRLIPGKLGLVLVQGYHRIDSSLVLPRVRSDIEDQCNKIAKGLATKDEVVNHAITLFGSKYDYFTKNIDKMDILFGTSFSKLEDVGKPFTRCGLSRRYLQYIPGPPPRLYNRFTETVYPLPIGGIVKQWSGRTCLVKDCNFELCLYSVGQPERTFPLCPRCYNDPDWALKQDVIEESEDKADIVKEQSLKRLAGRSLVLECPHPDEHPIIDDLTVGIDSDSDGVLILDPHFGPKWRLISTRTPTIIYLPRLLIDKVTVLNKRDEETGVHFMQVDFNADKSPLPDKATKHVCNFNSDEVIQGMLTIFHGSERTKASGRGGRGRGGRGRGRGSRGGGRGRGRG